MSSRYVTLPIWDKATEYERRMVLSFLCAHIKAQLGQGQHAFGSVDEMMGRLSIERVEWQSVSVRNLDQGRVRSGKIGKDPIMFASKRMLGRLLHQLCTVRVQQNPWVSVTKEGQPRLLLIVR